MIVPMKKIHLIAQKKDSSSTLNELRRLGVVHVEHEKVPAGARIHRLKERIQTMSKAVEIFKKYEKECPCAPKNVDHCLEMSESVVEQYTEIEEIKEDLTKRRSRISYWQPWGSFSPEDIRMLEEKHGIFIRLYEVPLKEFDKLPGNVIVQEIFSSKGIARCIVISRQVDNIPFRAIPLPEYSLDEMKGLQEKEKNKIEQLEKNIKEETACHKCLAEYGKQLQEELDFEDVLHGLGEREELMFLRGFCPVDQIQPLTNKAEEEQWGILIEDPSGDDNIPTLLKNPKWVDMIKPVLRFVDILPGYKEVDASLIFLVFFSVFFGMLIGDAAYGLIFIALTFFCQKKFTKKLKDRTIFHLLYLLSGCTVVWGLLTGTFFGQAWLANKVEPLVPWLLEFNNIILLCFLIGAVHLSIARLWQVIIRFPSITFLAHVGWMAIIWTVFFAAKMFVLNHTFPAYGTGMLIGGALLIIFFTEPIRNPLKVLIPRALGFMMSLVNAFADVVSYIRLFAVGLATVAIADAFNEMASGVGFNSLLSTLGAALILVIGHVLNMVLAGLAVLVHGIRLNVLEFSGHLNLEWSGRRYNPFRKVQ